MDVFIGTIVPWPIVYAPYYFELCQGQLLPVNQYQAAYSLLGNVFGGSGNTTFGIPDLRGRTIVGSGPYLGGTPVYYPGQTGGVATGTVTINSAQLPNHVHSTSFTPVVGPVPVVIPGSPGSGSISATTTAKLNTSTAGTAAPAAGSTCYLGGIGGKLGNNPVVNTGPYNTAADASQANLAGISVSVNTSGYSPATPPTTVTISAVTNGTVAVAGGGGNGGAQTPLLLNNMQPYLSMNFLISLQGLYPMRQS